MPGSPAGRLLRTFVTPPTVNDLTATAVADPLGVELDWTESPYAPDGYVVQRRVRGHPSGFRHPLMIYDATAEAARRGLSTIDTASLDIWMDTSGRGVHMTQDTSASQPLLMYDGTRWVVDFDGDDDWMGSGLLPPMIDEYTAAVAFYADTDPTESDTKAGRFLRSTSLTAAQFPIPWWVWNTTTTGVRRVFMTGTGASLQSTVFPAGHAPRETWLLWSVQVSGTDARGYRSGTGVVTTTLTDTFIGTPHPARLSVAGGEWNGKIASIVVLGSDLSPTDAAALQSWIIANSNLSL
jgi:hypothetical protein